MHSLLDTVQGKMILPPIYQSQLTFSSVPVLPEQNIAAGIGYLLKLLANFNWVLDAPAVSIPVPGHKHHMAHPSRTKHLGITGWKLFDFLFTAKHYNVGDGNYRGKLEYAYNLIQQRIKAQKGR